MVSKQLKSEDLGNAKSVFSLVLTLPKLYKSQISIDVHQHIKPQRDIYYSALFALSSAALAFTAQFIDKDTTHKELLVISSIGFALTLILVTLVHFLNIIFSMIQRSFENAVEEKGSVTIDVDNPNEELYQVDSVMSLMGAIAYLDTTLIITFIISILTYAAMVSFNL